MSEKIKVEIDSSVAESLRGYLKKHENYEYLNSDTELIEDLISSMETLSDRELAVILLGECSPEELLG